MTDLLVNRTIEQARTLGRQDLLAALGGLPPESQHAAILPLDTLAVALETTSWDKVAAD